MDAHSLTEGFSVVRMSKTRIAKYRTHFCTLDASNFPQEFTPLPKNAGFWRRFTRGLKQSTLLSQKNPRCGEYYRSTSEVMQLRKSQIDANSIIIHPLSMFRVYYEMWMGMVFVICQLYMPFSAAFDSDLENDLSEFSDQIFLLVDIILVTLCYIDIFFNFITGIVNEKTKTVEMEPRKIAKSYLLSKFFITDVLSSLPDMMVLMPTKSLKLGLNFLGILKFFRIGTTYRYITRTADITSYVYLSLGIIFFTFLVFHYFTCLSFIGPRLRLLFVDDIPKYSFVNTWGVARASVTTQYIKTFYIVSMIMMSIKAGVRVSVPWDEMAFVVFMYVLGKLLILFLTVVVVKMLLRRTALERNYYEIMQQLEGFMARKRVSPTLRKKIILNYHYKYNCTFFNENKITAILSEHMKREVKGEILQKLIDLVDIFDDLTPQELTSVVLHLRSEIYLPGDVIIKYGTTSEWMYFISSGSVLITSPSGKEICHLDEGNYFGEICLMYKDKKRTANVSALEICELYKMNRKFFNKCLKKNDAVMKRMHKQANKRMEMTEAYEDVQLRLLMTRIQSLEKMPKRQ